MAAPAYSYRSTARQQPARRPDTRPQRPYVQTIPGERRYSPTKVLPASANLAVAGTAVLILLMAVLAIAGLYLSSQAIITAQQSETVSGLISDQRSIGSVLEVQSSVVANSAAVKEKAAELGMSAPDDVTYITLPEDTVAVNEDGSLSLSESVERASDIPEEN